MLDLINRSRVIIRTLTVYPHGKNLPGRDFQLRDMEDSSEGQRRYALIGRGLGRGAGDFEGSDAAAYVAIEIVSCSGIYRIHHMRGFRTAKVALGYLVDWFGVLEPMTVEKMKDTVAWGETGNYTCKCRGTTFCI